MSLKRFEIIVECTAIEGVQIFGCMATSEAEAELMHKRGETTIIDEQFEVIGLSRDPMEVEESEDISSRLRQDVIEDCTARIVALENASHELIKALRVHHGITLDHVIGANTRKALQQLTDLLEDYGLDKEGQQE